MPGGRAAEVADRESEGSWTAFLPRLKERGLRGVEYVVSDNHEGLQHAISKVLPTALWQRCCVHFLRNARDKLSRSADPACLEGLKRLWGCERVGEAREALGAWVARWGDEQGFGRLVEWVEDHVEETLTVYRLPREHRLRMKPTNMLERYNEELRRRTRVARIFPNAESCLRGRVSRSHWKLQKILDTTRPGAGVRHSPEPGPDASASACRTAPEPLVQQPGTAAADYPVQPVHPTAPRGQTAATTGTSDRTSPQPTSNNQPVDDRRGPASRAPAPSRSKHCRLNAQQS